MTLQTVVTFTGIRRDVTTYTTSTDTQDSSQYSLCHRSMEDDIIFSGYIIMYIIYIYITKSTYIFIT